MKGIKSIIFDFGGVLVDWNQRYFYKDYFKNDEEMEYFLANVCTSEWNSEFDRGVSFAEGIRNLQARHPEYAEAIGLYREGWEKMLGGEFPDTVELLREMKDRGYAVYGLTNWSAETIGIAYARFGFFKLFDGIVVSGEEKMIKPDPGIYRLLLDRYGLRPEECVFIDDNAANVEAARKLGIHAIRFDNASDVRRRLLELL